MPAGNESEAAASLVAAIRKLQEGIDFATSIRELGVERAAFEQAVDKLISNAEADNQLFFNARVPDAEELRHLFTYAYDGKSIDF